MRWLGGLFASLELIGLGAWIGGMLVLGGLVAPTVFGKLGPDSGGDVMSVVFRQFNGGFVYACIVLSAVGFIGKFFLNRLPGKARWFEGAMLAVMILVGLYVGVILGPGMQKLRQTKLEDPSNGTAIAEFDRDHHLSVQLFSVNMVLGAAALVLNGREIALRGKK
jgi:uncharacterized membrane protein